jgi:6-phosphogluconolactonase
MLEIIEEKDQSRLLSRVSRHLCEKIRKMFARQELVNLAVPGGRNVAQIFQLMQAEQLAWERVHFFMVDERLVPAGHPDSNSALLQEHLVIPLVRAGRIDPGNAHGFTLEPVLPDRGARNYERVLAEYGFRYDIILLSSGEDGHVGALFPDHHSFADRHHGFIVMGDSPKPPPGRMTSSLSLLQTAGIAILLFVGEAKRQAYEKFNDPSCPIAACPAKLVLAIKDATVFTDLT